MRIGISLSLSSARAPANASNPVPTTTSLGTATNTMFADAATVLVNGTGFVNGASTVYVDGVAMTTAFVNSTQLSATFAASVHYPSTSGTLTRSVTVVTSAPGGGTSNAQTYTMTYSANFLFHVRADLGITIATGVSQWNDQTTNARHFTQATGGKRPTVTASAINGKPAITFDGVDDWLSTPAVTLTQPFRFYAFAKLRTWTNSARIIATDSATLWQRNVTPQIGVFAGTVLASATTNPLGTFAVLRGTFNGASSSMQENNATAFTGNAGASGGTTGIAMGSALGGATGFSTLDCAEAIGFGTPTAAEDANFVAYCTVRYGIP